MMRLQYESFVAILYRMIDREFELEKKEQQEVLKALNQIVFDVYMRRQKPCEKI